MTPELSNAPEPSKDPEDTSPSCGILDEATGAVCSLVQHSGNEHRDQSDWRFEFRWRTLPDTSLIVVGEVD